MTDTPKPANPATPAQRAAAARDRINAELAQQQKNEALKASVARDRWYFEHGEQPPEFEEGFDPDVEGFEEERTIFDDPPPEEPKPNGKHPDEEPPPDDGSKAPKPLRGISAAKLKGKQQPREFLDRAEVFPLRNVALFMGDGAIGKSLLILQLGIACTTNTLWLGVEVTQGPVVYFSCEDEEQEITNRLNDICEAEGIDLAAAKDLTILDMVGKDSVLAESASKSGRLKATWMLESLHMTMTTYKPVLLILDNLADVFAGDENNRGHAKQFITMLRGLCLHHGCTVILLGHPSLSGMSTGTGMSGSTAWNNSVRVRPYLHKPDGDDADADARIFEVMKANYAKQGDIRWELKWVKGRFVRTQITSAFTRVTVEDVDRVKLKFGTGRYRVNEQSNEWGGYAVADLLGWDIGRGIGAKERSKEQAKNRGDIRQFLAAWVKNKAIFVVEGLTANRETTMFYSHKPQS